PAGPHDRVLGACLCGLHAADLAYVLSRRRLDLGIGGRRDETPQGRDVAAHGSPPRAWVGAAATGCRGAAVGAPRWRRLADARPVTRPVPRLPPRDLHPGPRRP